MSRIHKTRWRARSLQVILSMTVLAGLGLCNGEGNATSYSVKNAYPEIKVTVVEYGWPVVAVERIRVDQEGKKVPLESIDPTAYLNGSFYYFEDEAYSVLAMGLVVDVGVTMVLVCSVMVSIAYWSHHRHRPLQFSLRCLLIVTAVTGVGMALSLKGWKYWCVVPIAFGCACTVFSSALLLYSCFERHDRKRRIVSQEVSELHAGPDNNSRD